MRRSSPAKNVTRTEFNRVLSVLQERGEMIENLQRTCSIQFERIAQMQAQIDHLQRLVKRRSIR